MYCTHTQLQLYVYRLFFIIKNAILVDDDRTETEQERDENN